MFERVRKTRRGSIDVSKNLRGKYYHSVDGKGRLIIPSKLRDGLGTNFIMTLGVEKCINLYSEEE